MEGEQYLGSPNKVPWTLTKYLLRQAASSSASDERELIEQNGLVSVFLGTNLIEAFTNIFFRVVAGEAEFHHATKKIFEGLNDRRFPLRKKLIEWPDRAFSRSIDKNDPRWKNFEALSNRRNKFTHFKSSHETVELEPNVIVAGLVDISLFRELSETTPEEVLECVKDVVDMVGECRGLEASQLPGFRHRWLGIPD